MSKQEKAWGLLAATAMLLAGCNALSSDRREATEKSFSEIGAHEAIMLVGTEPFWGGTVSATRFLYTTPENSDGVAIEVKRFAGLSGLGLSGSLDGNAIDLAITLGECSDGMSDRRFPFTATLKIGEEIRQGCAWTERETFSGPENP